jgi:hypothetical protein
MASKQPDFSDVWKNVASKDLAETLAAQRAKSSPAAAITSSIGAVGGNVINIGSISRAELVQLLRAQNAPDDTRQSRFENNGD